MTHRERFHALMRFQPVDRLPMLEWASWWDLTLGRWRGEGLPTELVNDWEIRTYFGLDDFRQYWIGPRRPTCPVPAAHGLGLISNRDEYEALKPHLFPEPSEILDRAHLEEIAARQATGEIVVWMTLEGFFWFPRTLLGIERHLYAFYEDPELMHAINEDLLAFNLRTFDAFSSIVTPDFMTFAEDMSFNRGPMISEDLFVEYIAPYYRRMLPTVHERGTLPFVDSDGDIIEILPWFINVGLEGFLPLERQAGCDVAAMRERHPRVRFIGAFDKMVMNHGEAAIRAEFERLLPVMRQGGFIPACDHQTPPAVSMEDYKLYVRLLREYCEAI